MNTYLLYHTTAEGFSIIISIAIFIIAWNSKQWIDNHYLLFLGIASLFVGLLDYTHAISYKGMGVFTNDGAVNRAASLWIAARYTESISFLIAPLYLRKKVKTNLFITIYAIITCLIILSILRWNIFPLCYIDGKGLTMFKIISEYVISLILLIAFIFLRKRSDEFDPKIYRLISCSIIATIFSELMFTLYKSPNDIFNLLGHLFKISSFYLIYKSLVECGIKSPFDLVFRNLKQREDMLEKLNKELEHKIIEGINKNRLQEQLLIQQSKMASMGEIVALIAHQWKQPLNAIALNIILLEDAYDNEELSKACLSDAVKAINNQISFMAKTADTFQNFLKPSKEETVFNVEEAILELVSMFNSFYKRDNIEIVIETTNTIKAELSLGYPNEFKQVILNMINNSRDAILNKSKNDVEKPYGIIKISISDIGNDIAIAINDNGGGIPADIIAKIYEPYFSTKTIGKGSGLGLYMAKTIIEKNMHGSLTVKNTSDGAEFIITLQKQTTTKYQPA
ncbi:PAS/PAC sensor signal transduction histidine kinase [Candidatus Magnetoovum chiemensis]|nr:PAS/PAC sensor signal transduction histidine kinase [Candidatus Magnetoovum chiemensis]